MDDKTKPIQTLKAVCPFCGGETEPLSGSEIEEICNQIYEDINEGELPQWHTGEKPRLRLEKADPMARDAPQREHVKGARME